MTADVEKYMRVQTERIKIETKVCSGDFYTPTLHFFLFHMKRNWLNSGDSGGFQFCPETKGVGITTLWLRGVTQSCQAVMLASPLKAKLREPFALSPLPVILLHYKLKTGEWALIWLPENHFWNWESQVEEINAETAPTCFAAAWSITQCTGSERFFLRFLFTEKRGISSFVDEKTSFFFFQSLATWNGMQSLIT